MRNAAQIGNRKYLTLILISVLKLEGSNRFEDLDVEMRIILILIEWVAWRGVEMWTEPR